MRRNILITGVSSGIGAAASAHLIARGDRVLGLSRRAPVADPAIVWEKCDVRSPIAVHAALERLLSPGTPLAAVICNAGIGGPVASVEETDTADARDVFDTNYFGVVHVLRAVLPRLRAQRSGRVLVVGSLAGRVPLPFQGHYAASKAALESFTFALRCEMKPFGVAVSLIEPGDIRTPINDTVSAASAGDSPYRAGIEPMVAATLNDVADAPGPEVVVRVIERALSAAHPDARYTVGPSTALVGLARRLFPDSLNLWIVRRHFGLE